jgi:urease accessory protein
LYPEGPSVCHAIVVHPPGGIAGGDELAIDVATAARAHAVLTTPGAGKLYKSAGRRAVQRVRLAAAGDSVVEWLPQETIVFDAAVAVLSLDVDVAPGALALAWEIVTLGRAAMGERFASGSLDGALTVRIGAARVVSERGRVAGGSAWLDSPVGWRGARAAGTFVAAGRAIDDGLVDACREAVAAWHPHAAVSRLSPCCLVGRFLGPSAGEARAAFSALRCVLRPALTGRAATPLRIWLT